MTEVAQTVNASCRLAPLVSVHCSSSLLQRLLNYCCSSILLDVVKSEPNLCLNLNLNISIFRLLFYAWCFIDIVQINYYIYDVLKYIYAHVCEEIEELR